MTEHEYAEADALLDRRGEEPVAVINGALARLACHGRAATGAFSPRPTSTDVWCRAERFFVWGCGAVAATSLGLIGHILLRRWL